MWFYGEYLVIISLWQLFSAPAASPTTIEIHSLNDTSMILSWRPPVAEQQNGIIKGYYVKLTKANTTTLFNYTTQEPYLLIINLEPGIEYTCKIAAFTVGVGPFSEAVTIMQDIDIDTGNNHSGKCSNHPTVYISKTIQLVTPKPLITPSQL